METRKELLFNILNSYQNLLDLEQMFPLELRLFVKDTLASERIGVLSNIIKDLDKENLIHERARIYVDAHLDKWKSTINYPNDKI